MKNFIRKIFPSKEVRAYRKMHRRHRKELMKLAEETREWDWGWLDDAVRIRIKHMHEYFSAGNNVWQTDETRLPIIEQLKHVLDLYDELDYLWDGESTDWDAICKREQELYEEIYSYIGCTLQHWWD
jgi:hypothetical protein